MNYLKKLTLASPIVISALVIGLIFSIAQGEITPQSYKDEASLFAIVTESPDATQNDIVTENNTKKIRIEVGNAESQNKPMPIPNSESLENYKNKLEVSEKENYCVFYNEAREKGLISRSMSESEFIELYPAGLSIEQIPGDITHPLEPGPEANPSPPNPSEYEPILVIPKYDLRVLLATANIDRRKPEYESARNRIEDIIEDINKLDTIDDFWRRRERKQHLAEMVIEARELGADVTYYEREIDDIMGEGFASEPVFESHIDEEIAKSPIEPDNTPCPNCSKKAESTRANDKFVVEEPPTDDYKIIENGYRRVYRVDRLPLTPEKRAELEGDGKEFVTDEETGELLIETFKDYLPENWVTEPSEDGKLVDSYGNSIVNRTIGLPEWSQRDIDLFKRELTSHLRHRENLLKALDDKLNIIQIPKNDFHTIDLYQRDEKNLETDLYETKMAIANFIGQAITRNIDISDIVRLDSEEIINNDVAEAIIEYLHFYENLKYSRIEANLFSYGNKYSRSDYSPEIIDFITNYGHSMEDVLALDPETEGRARPMATPSSCYTNTTFAQGMTYLSGYTTIWSGGDVDDSYSDVPIGFNFVFYGCDDSDNNTYTRVSSNVYNAQYQQGGGAINGSDYSNDAITSTSDPDGWVSGWWDDHVIRSGDYVRYKTDGSSPNRVFTTEYYSVGHISTSYGFHYLQHKFFEGSNKVEIHFGSTWDSGSSPSATIGMEDYAGTDGDCGPNCNSTNTSRPSYNYRYEPAGSGCISTFPHTENFNTGTGDWTNSGPSYTWSRSTTCSGSAPGATPSYSTGASCDHGGSGGLYYTEASGIYSQTHYMTSPCYNLSSLSNPVFEFWYHMYGSGMGTLYVDVSINGGSSWTTGIWSRSGQQHASYTAAWSKATVDLSSYISAQTVVRLRGVTGSSYTSDMCIDDLTVKNDCDCHVSISSYPYTEGFESGFSDWENRTDDDMNWTWKTGSTSSSSTGPTSAHGGSYYVYTETSGYYNLTAHMYGPCFDFSSLSAPEITFWYHMYGSAMGDLYLEASNDACASWSNVWSKSGDQGNSWHEATVDLSSYAGDSQVQLRFRGETGTSYTSDMAVDDITVQEGSTGTPGLWTGATSTSWSTGSNWDDGNVPTSSTDVTIPSGCPRYPSVSGLYIGSTSGSYHCANIEVQSGGSIITTSSVYCYGKATINGGTWNHNYNSSSSWNVESGGELEVNSGTVNIGRSSSDYYTDLILDSGGTVDINGGTLGITDEFEVNGTLTIASGTVQCGTYTSNNGGSSDAKFDLGSTGSLTMTSGYLDIKKCYSSSYPGLRFSTSSSVSCSGGEIRFINAGSYYNIIYADFGGKTVRYVRVNMTSSSYYVYLTGNNLSAYQIYIDEGRFDANGRNVTTTYDIDVYGTFYAGSGTINVGDDLYVRSGGYYYNESASTYIDYWLDVYGRLDTDTGFIRRGWYLGSSGVESRTYIYSGGTINVEASVGFEEYNGYLTVASGGTLNISGGECTISGTGSGDYLNNYGTVNISGGLTEVMCTYSNDYGFNNYSGGQVNMTAGQIRTMKTFRQDGGRFDMDGGTCNFSQYIYHINGATTSYTDMTGGTMNVSGQMPIYEGEFHHSGGTINDYGYYREADTGGGNYYGSGTAVMNFRGTNYIRLMCSGTYFNDINISGTYNLQSDNAQHWYINGDLTVTGSLDWNDPSSKWIYIQGDWNSSSGSVVYDDHVYFQGSKNATITTGGNKHFSYLHIQKPGGYGVSLAGNVRCEHLINDDGSTGYYDVGSHTHTSDGVIYNWEDLRMSSGTMNVANTGSGSGWSHAAFYFASGAVETITGGNIYVKGYGNSSDAIDIDGNFTPSGGTVYLAYTGSTTIYIDGSGTCTFYDLNIDRGSASYEVEMQRNLNVDNWLYLDRGRLDMGTYDADITGYTAIGDGSGTSDAELWIHDASSVFNTDYLGYSIQSDGVLDIDAGEFNVQNSYLDVYGTIQQDGGIIRQQSSSTWSGWYSGCTIDLSSGEYYYQASSYLNVSSGANISIDGGTLYIAKEIEFDSGAAFDPSGGTVQMYSGNAGIIDNDAGTSCYFYNLTINKSTGVACNPEGSMTVNNILDVSNGIFGLNSETYTVNGNSVSGNSVLVRSNGEIQMDGGTLTINTTSGDDMYIYSGGEVDMNSGTINLSDDFNLYGALNMSGGTIQNTYNSGAYGDLFFQNGSSGTMSGGTMLFYDEARWYNNTTWTMTGGTFRCGGTYDVVDIEMDDASVDLYNFTIDANVSAVATGCAYPFDINGSVTINSGAEWDAAGINMNVAGNWTSNGTFIHGNNTVTFDGGGSTINDGPSSSPFYDVVQTGTNINFIGSGGIDIDGDFTWVNGSMNVNSGEHHTIAGDFIQTGGSGGSYSTSASWTFDGTTQEIYANGNVVYLYADVIIGPTSTTTAKCFGSHDIVNWGDDCTINGKLILDDNVVYRGSSNITTTTIYGELETNSGSSNKPTFKGVNSTYRMNINAASGGRVDLNGCKFDYLGTNGLYLQTGAIAEQIDYCEFSNHSGRDIKTANLNGTGPYIWLNNNFNVASNYNVDNDAAQTIVMKGGSGVGWGETYDEDGPSGGNVIWWDNSDADKYWLGPVSTDWTNSQNWYPPGEPTGSDDIEIPKGCRYYPVTTGTEVCGSMWLREDASVTVNAGSFTSDGYGTGAFNTNIYGDFTQNGGAVYIGDFAYDLNTYSGSSVILNGGTFDVGDDVSINGSFTMNNSAIFKNNTDGSSDAWLTFGSTSNADINDDAQLWHQGTTSGRFFQIVSGASFNMEPSTYLYLNPASGAAYIGIFESSADFGNVIANNLTTYLRSDCAVPDINGGLTINTGCGLTTNSIDMNVAGNWTNNGTFTHGNNTVTFDGGSANLYTGGDADGKRFYDVNVNTSGTKTMQAELRCQHDLTIQEGRLTQGGITENWNIIDIDGDLTIESGGILNRTMQWIYVGGNWDSEYGTNEGYGCSRRYGIEPGIVRHGYGVIFDGSTTPITVRTRGNSSAYQYTFGQRFLVEKSSPSCVVNIETNFASRRWEIKRGIVNATGKTMYMPCYVYLNATDGGGLASPTSVVNLTNCTFSANTILRVYNGGQFNFSGGTGGKRRLRVYNGGAFNLTNGASWSTYEYVYLYSGCRFHADNTTTYTHNTWNHSSYGPNGYFYVQSNDAYFGDLVIDNASPTYPTFISTGSSQPIVVNGNFRINDANAKLVSNSEPISVKGNWTNNGVFDPGTGTVTFDGSGSSLLTGPSGGETFYNLTVDKTGTGLVNLGSNISVDGELDLSGTGASGNSGGVEGGLDSDTYEIDLAP